MLGFLVLLLLQPAGDTPAAAPPRPDLVVRVRREGRVTLDEASLARIGRQVHDLWRPYLDVGLVVSESAPRLAGRGDELELVITDRTLTVRDEGSLGWIEFVNGRPAQTITVSTTAARRLAEASTWNGRPLAALPLVVRERFLEGAIGRSIAHEIGHYLLASREHAGRGQMRARFSAADILQPRRINDRLESDEVGKVRRQLLEFAARAAAQPPLS